MKQQEPSQTASRVALTRAIEFLKPENRRICSDPFAKHFLDARSQLIYGSWFRRKRYLLRSAWGVPGVIGSVLARTRYIDECVADAVASGIVQLVILGAGYDTRGVRIEELVRRQVRVFEVDHPATQARKISILEREVGALGVDLTFVPLRFNSQNLSQQLKRAGYDPLAKTLFTWEGVTYYISDRAVDSTLAFVREHSIPGSLLIFDYFPPSVADGTCQLREARTMRALFASFGEGLTFGIEPARIEEFLSVRGFGNVRNVGSDQLKRHYVNPKRRRLKVSEIFSIVHATAGGVADG